MPSEVESLRRIGSSANNKSIPGDRLLSDSELPLVKEVRMSETSLKQPDRRAALQRLPSSEAGNWVHGAWHEAVIGSAGSEATGMTGIEGAAVIQLGRPHVPFQIAVECRLLEGLNSHSRPTAELRRRQRTSERPSLNAGNVEIDTFAKPRALSTVAFRSRELKVRDHLMGTPSPLVNEARTTHGLYPDDQRISWLPRQQWRYRRRGGVVPVGQLCHSLW